MMDYSGKGLRTASRAVRKKVFLYLEEQKKKLIFASTTLEENETFVYSLFGLPD